MTNTFNIADHLPEGINPAFRRIIVEAAGELAVAPSDGTFDGKAFLGRLYRKNAEYLAESLFLNFTTRPGWDAVTAQRAALDTG
ncbi:hypothetical protein P7L87_26185, partial [Vibrio parahaemolyticus]|nr:hypothetical protein [Vibrio parahaemolyticus]